MQFKISAVGPKLAALSVLTIVSANAAWAGFFGDHPRYLHSLSDLRYAKALLEHRDAPNVMADESNAVAEIDKSLGEIKRAAMDDWKPLGDPPPVDASLDHPGRLREALKVLERAKGDLSQEEDDRNARGLRNRAVGHLDNAIISVRQAIGDKRADQHL
jgi:hypothetical protein